MAKDPVRVLVTGAAGKIGRALVRKIARGVVLGPDQPLILHLLDIPPAAESLNGVKTELVDAAFPLLKGVVATTDVVKACTGVNIAIMLHGFPGEEVMEKKYVMSKNFSIFKSQASALQKHAAANCKVLVVGNPANTNALILKEFAPSIPEKNVTCLTGLDHNKALDQISERLNIQDSDDSWLKGKLSSGLSAASAAWGQIRDWVPGTPQGTRVSMEKEETCEMDEGTRDKVLRGVAVVGIGLAAVGGIGFAGVAVWSKAFKVIGQIGTAIAVGSQVYEVIGAWSDDSKEKGKKMK